ncbi:hypothetical protein FQ154_06100 [Paeniglutamicibacter gangotriensis]|uniref:Uncharacterized protein n=1 Tax=Paeniglutamicibacter gangotriensis TaxID=254787 RepID=A0A5B0EJC7_9MICC|nr:hypothetical protein [Paeniglutamicibacter gangotriensis]KAA0977830.1 hypothetical protein FQ154_06100 [Paeniglutamicibacter gangotriensis]
MSQRPPEPPQAKKSMFRYYDPARDERDRVVMLAHEELRAAGEKPHLLRTVDGELFSYRREEIGFVTGGSGAKISTGPGMLIAGTLCWIGALALASFMFGVQDATTGERVGLCFLAAFGAALAWYFMHLGLAEHRARKVRKARKLPKPLLGANLNLP